MPGVDAWCALADEVVAAERCRRSSTAPEERVLVNLGVTDDERAELAATIRGREDPAGSAARPGRRENAHTDVSDDDEPCTRLRDTEPDGRRARAVGRSFSPDQPRRWPLVSVQAARDVLAHLPADAAGSLVSGLVVGLGVPDRTRRCAPRR